MFCGLLPATGCGVCVNRNLDPPVQLATRVRAVGGDWLTFTAARGADAGAIDTLAGDEIRGRQRAPVRQVHVVLGAALGVGVTHDQRSRAGILLQARRKPAQVDLRRGVDLIGVECEEQPLRERHRDALADALHHGPRGDRTPTPGPACPFGARSPRPRRRRPPPQ